MRALDRAPVGAQELSPLPYPLTGRLWGAFGASSYVSTVAVRRPISLGVNSTETVQELMGGRVAGQLSLALKSPGSEPEIPNPETSIAPSPSFVTVNLPTFDVNTTGCAPNRSPAGATTTSGPLPLR